MSPGEQRVFSLSFMQVDRGLDIGVWYLELSPIGLH